MTADVVKLPFRFDNTQQPWTVTDGRDVLDELASLVAVRDSRCILVTSATLARETALVHRVSRVLGPSLARTVTGVQPHVPRESALELAQTARAVGADVVVSLGGGTVTDTVKAARMAISFGCSHPDDFDALVRPPSLGPSPVGQQGVPFKAVALPTTLSGAEFTNTVGIIDPSRRRKDLFSYAWLTPDTILLDPELAAPTPPELWRSTGVKLLSDAIEQLYAPKCHHVVTVLCITLAKRTGRGRSIIIRGLSGNDLGLPRPSWKPGRQVGYRRPSR
jgi:alcohol dehydrogenase class IV